MKTIKRIFWFAILLPGTIVLFVLSVFFGLMERIGRAYRDFLKDLDKGWDQYCFVVSSLILWILIGVALF